MEDNGKQNDRRISNPYPKKTGESWEDMLDGFRRADEMSGISNPASGGGVADDLQNEGSGDIEIHSLGDLGLFEESSAEKPGRDGEELVLPVRSRIPEDSQDVPEDMADRRTRVIRTGARQPASGQNLSRQEDGLSISANAADSLFTASDAFSNNDDTSGDEAFTEADLEEAVFGLGTAEEPAAQETFGSISSGAAAGSEGAPAGSGEAAAGGEAGDGGDTGRHIFRKNKMSDTNTKKKKKSRVKTVIKILVLLAVIGILAGGAFTAYVVMTSPTIDTNSIYTLISQPSTMYDANGEVLESTSTAEYRDNINIDEMPENLKNAVIAIEDKTFYSHHGFNFIRIFGAIKESITSGGQVSGTSTITQQLARNLYLTSERSMTRKIREAYYTVVLERNLTKDQILEAYLNTISLGYNAYGVQAAAQMYFSVDAKDLTLGECAVFASIPKSPSHNAPLKRYYINEVPEGADVVHQDDTYAVVYNDGFQDRQHAVLKNMLEQEMITQAEYDAAMAEDIRAELNPKFDTTSSISSYFTDYCLDEVTNDLMKEFKIDEAAANDMIYKDGLKIYTTLDLNMQKKAEAIFNQSSNFPGITKIKKDGNKNIVTKGGKIMLYSKDTYFNSDGSFSFGPEEYTANADGGITILKGHRVNIYETKASDGTKIPQMEFKNMYAYVDGLLNSIEGGYMVGIDTQFLSRDGDGNLVISGEFVKAHPEYFTFDGRGATVSADNIRLRQNTVQPQGSMVVTDYSNGQIKVMVGGRGTSGKMLYNRANSTRQPGSSIKPIGVYGPAIQSGVDKGTVWTAGSTVDDSENIVNGKVWPKNWYTGYRGLVSLRTCVEQSINVTAVRVWNSIGASYSVQMLKDNGITSIVESGDVNDLNPAALALGGMTKGITPIQMASAYGTFPNGGTYVEPVSYTKVEDADGNTILTKTPYSKQVYNEGVAFIMTDILRTTVSRGIAGGAAFSGQPVGGKTGTTTDNYDAWFVGFTPQFAASVWIGNDVNLELTKGSGAAAALWSKVMREVTSGMPYGSFKSKPSNVYVGPDGEYYVTGTKRHGGAAEYASGQVIQEEEEVTEEEVTEPENGEETTENGNAGEPVDNAGGNNTGETGGTGNEEGGLPASNPGGEAGGEQTTPVPVNPSPPHGVVNDN